MSYSIDKYTVTFAGSIEVDAADVEDLEGGALVILDVKSGGYSVKPMASGKVVRSDRLTIEDFSIIRSPALRQLIMDESLTVDEDAPAQLQWDAPDAEVAIAPAPVLTVVDDEGDAPGLIVAEPDEEEVFSPGSPTAQRTPTPRKDEVLANFLREGAR